MNLPTLNDPPVEICRRLRTKNAFAGAGPDEIPWQQAESTTAVFWCLCTMETAGPDDDYAHPTTCRPGRTCFRGQED